LARYLALDWDQNQLHIVSANVRGTSVQVQRATVWQEPRVPNPAEAEELGQVLRDRLKEAGISPAPVLACVGRDRVIVKEVRFPAVPDTEEPAIVRFQAVKELTDAADDVVLDYMVVGNGSSGERKAAALVVRREVLTTYQKMCQAAGLKLAALTPRLVGVSACVREVMGKTVVTPPPEPADGVIAVVVVGERTAELGVLRGESFLLARSLPAASNLASDIRRNLAVHAGQQPQSPVRAVYLAGKGTGELRERLGELVEVPVHTFDPFSGSEAGHLPPGNRGSFAGAVGLLHAQAAGRPAINFVSPRQPKPPRSTNFRLIRTALVAWAVLFVGLLVLGRVVHAKMSGDADSYDKERSQTVAELYRTKENAKRLKTIDDWDNPVALDEVYNLEASIADVNALRITSLNIEPIVTRTDKSKFAARMTLRGKLLDRRNPDKALNDLVDALRQEGFYTPQAPRVDKDGFTLVVNVERRAPTAHQARLPGEKDAPKPAEVKTETDKGKEKAKDKGGKAKSKAPTSKDKRSAD
jgi:Tfp pilus assembly PilM family ATPase